MFQLNNIRVGHRNNLRVQTREQVYSFIGKVDMNAAHQPSHREKRRAGRLVILLPLLLLLVVLQVSQDPAGRTQDGHEHGGQSDGLLLQRHDGHGHMTVT